MSLEKKSVADQLINANRKSGIGPKNHMCDYATHQELSVADILSAFL
jgi:hypothetical protein